MSHAHQDDQKLVEKTHNTARFFTENRHISWVGLVFTLLAGIYAYFTMPKRKDPEIPVRAAAAVVSWPGATPEKLEELVTERIEEKIAESSHIDKIESTTRAGVAVLTLTLDDQIEDTAKEFDDVWLKLSSLRDLPEGVRIEFIKDFGDTAALMLTIASPRASEVDVALRARAIEAAIAGVRHGEADRASLVASFPRGDKPLELEGAARELAAHARELGAEDVRSFDGEGFVGIDLRGHAADADLEQMASTFLDDRLGASALHPDVWAFALIRDPAETEARLTAVAGDKYSYRELEDYSDKIKKALQSAKLVSKVTRSGVVGEQVFLDYSQERMASYGVRPADIKNALGSRNIIAPGGVLEAQGKSILIAPAGEFESEDEIGSVAVGVSQTGMPIYLRDIVDIHRGYESPARYLNEYSRRDAEGRWQKTRAITLAVSMRSGGQIAEFGAQIDEALGRVQTLLPDDLVVARTSDQPQQVEESVDLFMSSLWEALALVIVVALIGFWEWRSALLMALSIPITLAMTFGMMRALGIDVQQISIASLIIALGLLVDDPVVAGDAIKRSLSEGWKPIVAAWLGPTKLAGAIMFATLTNIAAYVPFLALDGDSGRFIYSLPVVLTCSLIASRLVSMTFLPLLGYHLLRAPEKKEDKGPNAFQRGYRKVVGWAIDQRRFVFVAAALLVVLGGVAVRDVKQAFFPKDLSYLSYVDVWLPEDSPVAATQDTAALAAEVIEEVAAEHTGHGDAHEVLRSITTFVGGGGPRFWFSVAPEQRQSNYAQLVIQVNDKHDTAELVGPLQEALTRRIPGARIDVRQLESGPPIGIPVSIRVSGEEPEVLRRIAGELAGTFNGMNNAERVRDNWGADNFTVKVDIDADRANAAGVTNLDVAHSSMAALNGTPVGLLREGDLELPIVARLRASERARLGDVDDLYVMSAHGTERVPLRQIATMGYGGVTAKIQRRNHFRTITVQAFPTTGTLPSEVMTAARPEIDRIQSSLPPGYKLEIGGEEEEQKKGFRSLAIVLGISVVSIFMALVVQFRNAVKPIIVFTAIPFGVVGGLASLVVMGAPFGFMAFLGLISLIGVIVSHVIVLFDFIEERHAEGAPLRDALIDAGLLRLRPVAITVGATVLGLFPLAAHGGPLWEPLCYVQIGGLTIATFVTLLLVPVLYAIFVLDLRLVRWDEKTSETPPEEPAPSALPEAAH
jgi:multidrug efflux pump subunit AcrB